MKITPRKNEVAAVVAELENPDHADATAAAKAIIKALMGEIGKRDMACLAWRTGPGSPVVAWGPFASVTDAEKFGKTLSVGGQGLSVTLYSPQEQAERAAEASEPRSGTCKTCGHPFGTHQHEKQVGKCQLNGCNCTYLVK